MTFLRLIPVSFLLLASLSVWSAEKRNTPRAPDARQAPQTSSQPPAPGTGISQELVIGTVLRLEELGHLKNKLPDQVTSAAEKLQIYDADDVIKYFMAHRARAKIVMLDAVSDHGKEVLRFYLGRDPSPQELEDLETFVGKLASHHDEAKMTTQVAEGLRRIFGVNAWTLPGGTPEEIQFRDNVKNFILKFNEVDALVGKDVLPRKFKYQSQAQVVEAAYFFECVGDLVDRTLDPDAAVEMGKDHLPIGDRLPISSYDEDILLKVLKDLGKKPGAARLYRKVTAHAEQKYVASTAVRRSTFGALRRSLVPAHSALDQHHHYQKALVRGGIGAPKLPSCMAAVEEAVGPPPSSRR
jgi:hypothetical protein